MISYFFRGCKISVFGKCWFAMDWKDLFKHAICHLKKPNVYPDRNGPERFSKHPQLLQTGLENQLMVVIYLVVLLKIHHAFIDWRIRLMAGQRGWQRGMLSAGRVVLSLRGAEERWLWWNGQGRAVTPPLSV